GDIDLAQERERFGVHKVQLSKTNERLDLFLDLVSTIDLAKETPQIAFVGLAERVPAVNGFTCDAEHASRNVVAENPYVPIRKQPGLENNHRATVGFLARRTACAPQGQTTSATTLFMQLGQDFITKRVELVALPKRIGFVGGDAFDNFFNFIGAA